MTKKYTTTFKENIQVKQTKTLSVRQAALRMGNTRKYISDLLYEEKLPGAQKQNGRWQIPLTVIEQRLKEREKRNG